MKTLIISDIEQLKNRMDKNAWYILQALTKHREVKSFGTGCKGFIRGMASNKFTIRTICISKTN